MDFFKLNFSTIVIGFFCQGKVDLLEKSKIIKIKKII